MSVRISLATALLAVFSYSYVACHAPAAAAHAATTSTHLGVFK